MFYRNDRGWHFFSYTRNTWINSNSLEFNTALTQQFAADSDNAHRLAGAAILPAGALPAFNGSKIICVGRNYRNHAAELGNDVPKRPLWFFKPPSSIIGEEGRIVLPQGVGRIDYEGELGLLIGKKTRNISVHYAEGCIGGVTACLDMTARELQKSDGQWTRAKGFDTFLPLASMVAPYSPAWKNGSIEVYKNGELVQKSGFSAMVFGFAELIADLSACMTLEPGDLILTGTPEGVGPVAAGDQLSVSIIGPERINLSVNVAG